jgi:5,10-methylenetetrahydromethanopterin reductase
MRIGVFAQDGTVDGLTAQVADAQARGFVTAWVPQIFQLDALTALAVVAREVPDIGLGTAVVPTYPRHPMTMAGQARTLQQVAGGRFTLGIGLSHQIVVEGLLGMTWGEVRHLREYLSILVPLLEGEPVNFEGETLTGKLALDIPADPVPVVVAALGPKMLDLAGRMADGTVTWMTGLETLRSHIVPSIGRGASEAGRPVPRVVAALPTAITDDPDGARELAAKQFSIYGQLPSYRAMLDREGAGGPGDVALVGDEATVKAGIEQFFEAGATEFVVVPFTERDRTLDFAASLL